MKLPDLSSLMQAGTAKVQQEREFLGIHVPRPKQESLWSQMRGTMESPGFRTLSVAPLLLAGALHLHESVEPRVSAEDHAALEWVQDMREADYPSISAYFPATLDSLEASIEPQSTRERALELLDKQLGTNLSSKGTVRYLSPEMQKRIERLRGNPEFDQIMKSIEESGYQLWIGSYEDLGMKDKSVLPGGLAVSLYNKDSATHSDGGFIGLDEAYFDKRAEEYRKVYLPLDQMSHPETFQGVDAEAELRKLTEEEKDMALVHEILHLKEVAEHKGDMAHFRFDPDPADWNRDLTEADPSSWNELLGHEQKLRESFGVNPRKYYSGERPVHEMFEALQGRIQRTKQEQAKLRAETTQQARLPRW